LHNKYFVSFLLIVFCFEWTYCQSVDCTYTNSSGAYWNLTPLRYDPSEPSPSGYSLITTQGSTFYVNFCDEVSTNNLNDCNSDAPAGSCQQTGNPSSFYSAGAVSGMTFTDFTPTGSYTDGIAIKYTDGNVCTNVGLTRQTTINVICDPTVDGFQLISESEPSTCTYIL